MNLQGFMYSADADGRGRKRTDADGRGRTRTDADIFINYICLRFFCVFFIVGIHWNETQSPTVWVTPPPPPHADSATTLA